jgi:hypothetical protein
MQQVIASLATNTLCPPGILVRITDAMSHNPNQFDYRDHIDPEYQRWGRTYPRFPGVNECVRLLRSGNTKGAWTDIIIGELATHAGEALPELVAAFRSESNQWIRLMILMAIELARLPAAIPFLVEVEREQNSQFAPYVERGLAAIDTKESRAALWHIKNGSQRSHQ